MYCSFKVLGDEKLRKYKRENRKLNIKGIKKPKFIVFTDKDGTLNLEDQQLSNTLKLITKMGGMVVPITGRTVGDIKEDFKRRNIMLPPIIIGDNGAVVYSTVKDEFIIKRTLENEKATKILKAFIDMGGKSELIRYTDGNQIHASKEQTVKEYYRNSKTAKLHSKIEDKFRKNKDITKITLAGTKKEMEEMSKYAETLGFWTDMDATKFPKKGQGNYRLDIAPKNISKGKMVKAIAGYFKPEYGYICVGNGYNDVSMFKQAIDDGMVAAIMGNSDPELISQIQEYATKSNIGKAVIVPRDMNKANRWIHRTSKVIESHINANKFRGKKQKRKNKAILPNVPKVKVPKVMSNKQSNNTRTPKTKNKEIEK